MKKYIIILIVTIGLFTSMNSVFARTNLSARNINTIVKVLQDFGVEEYKITEIIKILKSTPKPVVQPVQKESTSGRCWKYNPCVSA